MQKKIVLLLLAALTTLGASAQLNGNGYYRLKNKVTGNYATFASDVFSYDQVLQNVGASNMTSDNGKKTAALKAGLYLQHDIKMVADPTTVPASIFYLKNQSSNTYNLLGNGANIYDISTGVYTGSSSLGNVNVDGFYAVINKVSGGGDIYTIYVNPKVTVTVTVIFWPVSYTCDMGNQYFKDSYGNFSIEKDASSKDSAQWYIEPVTTFNVSCLEKVKKGDYYYTTLCVDFPFTIPESGSTVHAAYKVIGKNADGFAVLEEITGTIPGGTPVLLECSSYKAEDNVLNIATSTAPAGKSCDDGAVVSSDGNYLQGRYFNSPGEQPPYYNAVNNNNKENMYIAQNILTNNQTNYRVLNIVDGQVGFYKLKNASSRMGANKAFLNIANLPTVSDNNTKAFSMEAGDGTTGITTATTTHDNVIYDLQGRRVTSINKGGIYIVNGKKVAY